ncbi:MAG: carboxypeptidase Taq [Myxococcota bacterium]|jgi:carboxypeptidase Taq
MSDTAWKHLTTHITELQTLASVHGLLQWDQQVNMPPAAAGLRANQNALMAGLVHKRRTDPAYGDALNALLGSTDPVRKASVTHLKRDYDRNTKLSTDLVARLGRAQANGFQSWMAAREADDFAMFVPELTELVALSQEKAAAIDSERPAYDVLLDEFDYGTSTATLVPMFTRLRDGLTELVQATRDAPAVPPIDLHVPVGIQKRLHETVIAALGYDLSAGRLDTAQHPFSIGLGRGDVRITTHIYENDLLNGLGGTVHEAGHAMYEQGLPHDTLTGTGLNVAASYGLHESQSRFWENTIGGSLPFFQWFSKHLAAEDIAVTADALYRASNRIEPGLIRISADEVTYNLHILLRFELEMALFDGSLAVKDIPDAWNAGMQKQLGQTPSSDVVGALQDVHWSGGAFGYFPSYTLGNLYAASLAVAMEEAVPDMWEQVAKGEFSHILAWLRSHVHQQGSQMSAPDIVRQAVGDRDPVEDLLSHLWSRHGGLYGVTRMA